MAEIRKHKQTNSAIAQAIEAAMGASVRPTTPGAPPEPNRKPSARSTPGTTFTSMPTTGTAAGWAAIDPSRLLDAQHRARGTVAQDPTEEDGPGQD